MTFIEKFNINSNAHPVILIAPLDWGLGHATRCIPIINYLISIGCEVIIAGEGLQASLLRQEFPKLRFVPLAGYKLKFSNKKWKTLLKIIWQIPKIIFTISREKKWLTDFLIGNKIDAVISDNRYGLYNRKIASVFITHQLTIKTPFGDVLEFILRKLNYRYIQHFTECWVPDFEGEINMGGELSHPNTMPRLPVKFIGRLTRIEEKQPLLKKIELLVILSGPEPQRSIFENILLDQLNAFHKSAVLVRGLPGEKETLLRANKHLHIYNHLDSVELSSLIYRSTYIVSRSGYSTVMDVTGLHKKCIFVPTPGQTEQEYLARYLSSRNTCLRFVQSNFSLTDAIKAASKTEFAHIDYGSGGGYKEVVADFITTLKNGRVN